MWIFFLNCVYGNFMLAIFTCYNITVNALRLWKIRSKNLLIPNLCTVETKNMFSVSYKLFLNGRHHCREPQLCRSLRCSYQTDLDVYREMWYGCNGHVLSFTVGHRKDFRKWHQKKSTFHEASH